MVSKNKFGGFGDAIKPEKAERPLAKRKDANFERHNFFIRSDVYRDVAMILAQRGRKAQDWSDLVTECLALWVSKQPEYKSTQAHSNADT
jgi:hypothetical protein